MQYFFDRILGLKTSEIIALSSLVIALLSLICTIQFNRQTRNQHRQSLSPLLSFRLIENNSILYLAVTNTGRSEAKNIKLEINELCNNGDMNSLEIEEVFLNEFNLFPNESVQSKIGFYGKNLLNQAFPSIKLNINYIKGNDNMKLSYDRTIYLTTGYQNKIAAEVNLDLKNIPKDIKALSRSNIRIANYLDGHSLSSFDELEIITQNNLKNDLKEAISNNESTVNKK